MTLPSRALSLILLCPGFVWNSYSIRAFRGGTVDRSRSRSITNTRQSTRLHPHRFNGGYDPSSPLTWTPQQAAEFTIFHDGSPEHAGMQLRTAVQHWSGTDLAEFLTRLYLGHLEVSNEPNDSDESKEKRIVYEPQNVRSPKWEGLETREGILALKGLLRESLSKEVLSAQEIARFAEAFLLKEYRWPSRIEEIKSKSTGNNVTFLSSESREIVFEQDSFYTLGHARTLARVLLVVRKERGFFEFNWNDVAMMVTLPEKRDEDREVTPLRLIEFLRAITTYAPLTASDKANIVQRMAISGWSSASIPKFMAELFPTESLSDNHNVDQMCRLDSFFDFPAAATIRSDRQSRKEWKNAAAIAVAKDLEKGIIKEKKKETGKVLSKRLGKAKDKERSEYEDLVKSYWKKVEVKTTMKPPGRPTYGVPRTKSIKKREIPVKAFDVSKAKAVVGSKTNSCVDSETTCTAIVKSKTKTVVSSKTKTAMDLKKKAVLKSVSP